MIEDKEEKIRGNGATDLNRNQVGQHRLLFDRGQKLRYRGRRGVDDLPDQLR